MHMRRPRTAVERRRALRQGSDAESRVEAVLQSAGWTIRARNWQGSGAELDLVVSRSEQIRFVEVKQRAGSDHSASDLVDGRKQQRLVRAARAWLAREQEGTSDMAFTVAIVDDQGIHWIDEAFEA